MLNGTSDPIRERTNSSPFVNVFAQAAVSEIPESSTYKETNKGNWDLSGVNSCGSEF